MSFDWKNYLLLSEEFAKRTEESCLRSSISRAYYGVWCIARNKKGYKNYKPKRGENIHLIKQLKDKLDLTQEQFAQKVGVTFPTINNWEKANRTPHPFLFQRLMEMAEQAALKNIENIKRK